MSLADQQWCPTSVQVTVLQARGLRIKGKSGTNDAYAVMQVGKEKYQTSVVEKSVAPVWKEESSFDLPPVLLQGGGGGGGGGGKERSTLHVHVLHRALVGPDKLLGQAVINLLQLSEDKTRNKTEWFKLLDKTGKPDKDRGEVLLDIQFMRNNMTASMFDLSAAGKSRSRLGKFKDKVRGKKKELGSSSGVVPSLTQVLTDSEEEDATGGGERGVGKYGKAEQHKRMSLFSSKSNLQRNMSQSMSVLPAKNSLFSGSQSSGLNVDSSEGKKKFKFKIHKHSSSSDSKDSSSGQQKQEQSNLCINGSHVYCEELPPRTSRTGSSFSLSSSGRGSMEDVPENSFQSVDSLKGVREYSPWMEEEEEERDENIEVLRKEEEKDKLKKDIREEEEAIGKQQKELDRLAEEKLRREEVEKVRKQEEEWQRLAEEKRLEEERRCREEKERAQERRQEEHELAEENRKLKEEEERRMEEEKVKREQERAEEQRRKKEQEEKRQREEGEMLRKEKMRMEEEEKARREKEHSRLMAEKRREEERIEAEEKFRKAEEKRIKNEEEIKRKEHEEKLANKKKLEEQERREEQEKIRKEEERRKEGEESLRHEELERLAKQKQVEEEEREEEERIQKEKMRREEEGWKRRQEELEKLAKEKLRQEEEEKRKAEEERVKKEEEETIQKEKMRKEEEERRKEGEERKRRQDELEKLAKEKLRKEEEEKRAEKERVKREEEAIQKEKMRKEEEERKKKEEEERRKKEEEEWKRRQEEMEKLAKEKLRQEEEEKKTKERFKREEEEMIQKEKMRQEEGEEEKKIEEMREEKTEEDEAIKKEKQEKMREEEKRKRAAEERVKDEKRGEEELEKKTFEVERIRRAENAEKERREEEERKQENFTKEKESKIKEEQKSVGTKLKLRVPAEITSTNPFDENFTTPEETPNSPKAKTDDQRCQSAVSSVESGAISTTEKDLINTPREKRAAPKPPGRNQPERLRQEEEETSMQHLSQINKQSKDKDVKTVSVAPQRSVLMISPLNRSSKDFKNTQSITEDDSTKDETTRNHKRPAPSVPCTAEEKLHRVVREMKENGAFYGLNPFEDDDDENELRVHDDMSSKTEPVCWPPIKSQTADKDAVKIKSSKARAPLPPAPNDTPSSSKISQNHDERDVSDDHGADAPNKACNPQKEVKSHVQVQKTPNKESKQIVAGVKVEGPRASSRRLQPVKPLNPLAQQSDSDAKVGNDNKATGLDRNGIQHKTNVGTGRSGPYSQLTREELIALLLKQETQLSERDKKISELEQYIDNLLVRVIEENPSILISMSSLKKAA